MSLNKFFLLLQRNKLIVIVILLIPLCNYQVSYLNNGKKKEFKYKIFKSVIDSLIKRGGDSISVLSLVNDYRTYFNERFAKVNIVSQPKLDFTNSFDKKTLKKIENFIYTNEVTLAKAEQIFKVPKEIVAILLWVESRFGNVLGKNHLPSVFLSMATATNPNVLMNIEQIEIKNGISKDSAYKILYQRAKMKENFALNELLALIEIQKRGLMDIYQLYGSYSGAFGIPQFLPSSYLNYGFDGNGDGKVDLFNLEDAIFSVGNFLSKNGWKEGDTNSYYQALFRYNRSKTYVEAVLKAYNDLKRKDER
ncbi:MAG: lytic murein transglycosylase [Bacteroidota bacterium]